MVAYTVVMQMILQIMVNLTICYENCWMKTKTVINYATYSYVANGNGQQGRQTAFTKDAKKMLNLATVNVAKFSTCII